MCFAFMHHHTKPAPFLDWQQSTFLSVYLLRFLALRLNRQIYSEADVRRIMIQLMRGVAYLHSRGICHRDLKVNPLVNMFANTMFEMG